MSIRILMAAVLALAAVGCDLSEYDHTNVHKLAGDAEADVTPGGLFVPRGGVLMFEAQPVSTSSSPDYKGWEQVELASTQPDVAQIREAIVRDAWVINGKRVGSGSIRITIDGEQVDTIDFDVQEVVP